MTLSERIAAPFWWFTDWLFWRHRRIRRDTRRQAILDAISVPITIERPPLWKCVPQNSVAGMVLADELRNMDMRYQRGPLTLRRTITAERIAYVDTPDGLTAAMLRRHGKPLGIF